MPVLRTRDRIIILIGVLLMAVAVAVAGGGRVSAIVSPPVVVSTAIFWLLLSHSTRRPDGDGDGPTVLRNDRR